MGFGIAPSYRHRERNTMKLQLWTTVNDQADESLGEIDVDDEEWHDAQADAGSALDLVQTLASELGSECL